MLWKLIIKVLEVYLFFGLLWVFLAVRFGDDVAKGSPRHWKWGNLSS
jgi:hypothetical protein